MAEVRSLLERPRAPGQLATGKQQLLVPVVIGRHAGERRNNAGRTMTPLHADSAISTGAQALRRGDRWPVREPVLFDCVASHRLSRAAMKLAVSIPGQGEHAAR